MEKKYLNEFVKLFSYLPNALSIAAFELGYKELEYKKCQNGDKCVDYENSTERARDIEWKKVLEPHISEQTDKIERIFILQADKPESNLLFNLKNEIDSNLYSLSQDKILLYVKDIVRQFADIAPFFDTSIKTNFKIGEHTFENTTKKSSKHLLEYFSSEFYKCGEKYENLSISKKYFYNCIQLLDLFARELEKLCNTFGVDFAEIQRNLDIYLQWHDGDVIAMNDKYSIPKVDDNCLNKIFRDGAKDDLIRLEGILKIKGLLDNNGRWSTKKGAQVALKKFLYQLQMRNYFKQGTIQALGDNLYDYKQIKEWVKNRYGIASKQFLEPSRMRNLPSNRDIDTLDYNRF